MFKKFVWATNEPHFITNGHFSDTAFDAHAWENRPI